MARSAAHTRPVVSLQRTIRRIRPIQRIRRISLSRPNGANHTSPGIALGSDKPPTSSPEGATHTPDSPATLSPRPADSIYHWLLGDPGMASYDDKVIKSLAKSHLDRIKLWKQNFLAPYAPDDLPELHALSAAADALFQKHLEFIDLFARRGGFDLILGNPPWVKVEWNEGDLLSETLPAWLLEKKPRRLRSSIARAFGQLANPDFVDLMRVRKLQEERDTFW